MKKETKKLFKELFTRIERLEEKFAPTSKTNESSDIFKGTGDTTTTTVQLKTPEIEGIKKPALGNTNTSLSIREVQVKVSSQEEANECAEIAKACGEKIWEIDILPQFCFFRKQKQGIGFGVFQFSDDFKEISIQEYRERFGKENKFEIPKYITQEEALEFGRKLETSEIDWSKAGQRFTNGQIIVMSTNPEPITRKECFAGLCIHKFPDKLSDDNVGHFSYNWLRKHFQLCTEPITLSND